MCQTDRMPMRREDAVAYQRAYRAAVKAGTRTPRPGVSLRTGDPLWCAECRRSFYRSPANRESGKAYCSRACMSAAFVGRFVGAKSPRFRGVDKKPCDHCGTIVSRPKWASNGQAFCNRTYFGAWRSMNWCAGNNPAWRGGHAKYYGGNWKRQAREARRRDGHACCFCGLPEIGQALDVHHIVPFRQFTIARHREANVLSNLVALCPPCHKHVERWCDGTVTSWSTLMLLARTGLPV